MTHNGWANYETWLFWSHMSNDGYWYEEMHRITKEHLEVEDAVSELGYALRDFMNDEIHVHTKCDLPIVFDMIEACFSEVRWREIAENLLDDYAPESEDEGALIIEFVTDESKSES